MSCCWPLKICNNITQVSTRQPLQEPQRCGQDRVVRRLSITHKDHILARFTLINWLAYRLDQHCMVCLLFPCRRPCRRGIHYVCVSKKERKKNRGREQNMSQWWFDFPCLLNMTESKVDPLCPKNILKNHKEGKGGLHPCGGRPYIIWCILIVNRNKGSHDFCFRLYGCLHYSSTEKYISDQR